MHAVHLCLPCGPLSKTALRIIYYNSLKDVQKLCLHKGGEGGKLGAILCKLFSLEVYIKRGGGGQKSRKYANIVYVRPLTTISATF